MEYNPDYDLRELARRSDARRNNGNRSFARRRWKARRKVETWREYMTDQAIHARRARQAAAR